MKKNTMITKKSLIKTEFAVFILSFGRPDRVYTYDTLRRLGFNGKIYIICSDDDANLSEYKQRFGDEVIVFSKSEYDNRFDIGDNFKQRNSVVYARNASFDIAEKLGIKYFLELDDDYTSFAFRFDGDLNYKHKIMRNSINDVIENVLLYLDSAEQITCIAFAQGGDFMGGQYGTNAECVKTKRKVMNTFFMATDRIIRFDGRINEDVNAYLHLGKIGKLVLQTNQVCIQQVQTQTNSGGLTDIYLELGTYVKSFYSCMMFPSCVKVTAMGNKHMRLHHSIRWNNAAVKIVREEHRK